MTAKERFLKYVSFPTTSDEKSATCPSTAGQSVLLSFLKEELCSMGIAAEMDDNGYVTAKIPANKAGLPVVCFLSHVDTSPAVSGENIRPKEIVYRGGDVLLENGVTIAEKDNPELKEMIGETLIVTDGNTLLGADDKAGVAEIMTAAEYLATHPEFPHGEIAIAFTPDEEIGRGTDRFDVKKFAADFGYTVDGGKLGEIEYENFNAASGKVRIQGASIHPGDAKLKMKNALLIGMEFQSLLPAFENPMYTEGYEGFYHLDEMSGNVEEAQLNYIIRDHDHEKFEQKKKFFAEAADFLNRKYGKGTVIAEVTDSYYNMKEKIEPCMYLIDTAKEAMTACGIEPEVVPIRGGTDGARLSYMGLPCPNLCTGGYNYHGKYEFIPVDSLQKTAEILVEIGKRFAALVDSNK